MPDEAAKRLPTEGREALERFLAGASARGEAIVSSTRLVLCLLALARMLIMSSEQLAAGNPKYWISAVALLFGAFSSVPWLLAGERAHASPARLHGSVVLDTAVLTVVLAPMVLWPTPEYLGVLREFATAGYLLVVVASGARLTPSAAVLGIVINAGALGGLLVLDATLWPDRLAYLPGDVALGLILFLGASVFAWGAAKGTRLLVYRGANAYSLARRATKRLGMFVSPEVAQEAVDGREAELGGKLRDVAVLFSDLRGFTSYSETLLPEQLVSELNAYFEAMVAVITREGGQVDKFVGDAIMAVFSADGAACAAVRAAEGMQRELNDHNAARAARQLPPFRQGVGVHFGPVVVGNIGTQQHMQHTVIGDTVNVASRLESATKEREVLLLVSAACVERAREEGGRLPPLSPNGRLSVRGRVGDMEVYALGDGDDD